jgi:uncharacterized protein (DUF305 family)
MNTIGQITILAAFTTLSTAAFAQDSANTVTVEKGMPAICTGDAGHSGDHGTMAKMMDKAGEMMGTSGSMMMSGAMDMAGASDAGKAMMQCMADMNRDMMAAMSIKDPDIAFLCGMIPHHRGAIAMAKAELEYGKNEWAKNLAKQIIEDQEREIKEMLARLEEMK